MASKQQSVTQALLARAHSPDSANRLFTDKIQHRTLHLRPSSPPPTSGRDARRRARQKQLEQRKKALKTKPLSARQRRKLGLYEVPKEGQKYAIYEPLHRLWLGYIREILGNEINTGGQGAAAKLASADFHGAEVEVVRSGCVSRVGIKGIVIKDSRFVFEIITKKNHIKTVPKEGTIFRVEVPAKDIEEKDAAGQDVQKDAQQGLQGAQGDAGTGKFVFELHGEQFRYRPADRATKKFKTHFLKNI
ncbi:RNase P/MRP, p29 subunit [Coniochaeta ligniaria NRRL 30616]|uniref:Ribonuclease P protein subunit n=1 Tax=Coniochaeta ligniaria NRRL 30616 TaxID=1408157 RepID=A0A1J7IZN6_9PEZI|nr:RNase P/MRP, p29 subunit [Coniochaeta ligniaria NRRL 30616]